MGGEASSHRRKSQRLPWRRAGLTTALALALVLAMPNPAQAQSRPTLEPGSLSQDMLMRPWHSQTQAAWPALPLAGTSTPRSFAWTGRTGWSFSLEVQDAHQDPAVMAAALRLPLLGSTPAGDGKLLAGGLYKAFGPWTLRINVRQQSSVQYGSFQQPGLGLTWQPESGPVMAGVKLTRSSRTPSFYTAGNPMAGNGLVGNQRSQQMEFFVANAQPSAWRARLTMFAAYYRDMLDLDGNLPPSLINRAQVYTRGMEASLSRRFAGGGKVYLHAARLNSYDPDTGFDLRYRPQQQATGGFALPVVGPLHLHASLTWYGRRIDSTTNTETGGATEAGLMLSWKSPGRQAFVALDNITNRKLDDLPDGWGSGRRLRLGLQTRF